MSDFANWQKDARKTDLKAHAVGGVKVYISLQDGLTTDVHIPSGTNGSDLPPIVSMFCVISQDIWETKTAEELMQEFILPTFKRARRKHYTGVTS